MKRFLGFLLIVLIAFLVRACAARVAPAPFGNAAPCGCGGAERARTPADMLRVANETSGASILTP